MIKLIEYDKDFLNLSWLWLNDSETKSLTMTPDFTRQEQAEFFNNIKKRHNYKIWGISYDNEKIGACGLKNITSGNAELWCYIGEKKYWGTGLGKDIIKNIENESKKIGIKLLSLTVSKENNRALSLYLRNGFIEKMITSNTIEMEKCLK